MNNPRDQKIRGLFHVIAAGRVSASGSEAWDYGWCLQEYRRSTTATASGPDGPVHISVAAVAALEEIMKDLLGRDSVARTWDANELWGTVLTAVTTLPIAIDGPALDQAVQKRLEPIISQGPTFVAFEVANVAWTGPPRLIGEAVIGRAGKAWWNEIAAKSKGRLLPSEAVLTDAAVVYGAWTKAHGSRAEAVAEQRLDETIALSLLLEPDPAALELFSGRGDAHRPGIRGLVIDREALVSLKEAERDTVARVVVSGPIGERSSHRWWGDKPFPLSRLLEQPGRHESVDAIVTSEDSVSRRFAIAATWYAKSHWSKRTEDAVLALGIALDSLLGDRAGFPRASEPATGTPVWTKRFSGYGATHHRVHLSKERVPDQDQPYADARLEIQVASVLMHAWSEVEHDLIYKPLTGELSEEEQAILDELNGVILAGEIALERLQAAGERRLTATKQPFRSPYDVATVLIEHARAHFAKLLTDTALGRTDVLAELLIALKLNTPEALRPFLDALDPDVERRPLSEQVIERVIAGDPGRVALYQQIQRGGGIEATDKDRALGAFVRWWAILEQVLSASLQRRPAPTVDLTRKGRGLLKQSSATELDRLRQRRNQMIHSGSVRDAIVFGETPKRSWRLFANCRLVTTAT